MAASSNEYLWGIEGLRSTPRKMLLVCFVAAIFYLAAKLGDLLFVRPEAVWPLWLGNVLLVSILLLLPRRIWPILIAAAFAGYVFFDLQTGMAIRSTAVLILSDTVEVLVATFCLSHFFTGVPRLNSVKALAKFSLLAVILAPFVGASIGAVASGGNYLRSWRISFFSEAIGFLILMPAIFGWVGRPPASRRKSYVHYLEAGGLITFLTLLGYLVFVGLGRNSPPALLYSLVPFLLWAALRFGSTGVSTSMIVIAFLSIWGVVHGRGPFTGHGPLDDVFSLQLFLLFATVPFMILAVLVEERKNTEQALKKSEEKFSIAFRECPSGFALVRLKDDRYIEVNEAMESFTGYERDEIIGRTPIEVQIWENPSRRIEFLKELRAEGKLRNVEVRFRVRNGGIRIGLASAELIEVDDEECLLLLISDITELKQAQEARLSHAAIVESSDDAIISKDLDGIILSWNAGARRIFGFAEAEAVGEAITITVPPELQDEERRMLQRLNVGESIEHYETVRITKDAKKINVSLIVSPLRDSTGRIVGFCEIARDITDRKRAENVLRETEERFRLVADTAPVLIWMSGLDKQCTFFNKGWLDFTGRSIEQELGSGWSSGVHPEDLEHCLGIYSRAFDARVDFEMEYRLKRFDGKYRWIVDYGVPRFESDGTFCGYIGSCVDITERRSSEMALEELSGRLITAQEEERSRIARELHDDFSQRLALQGIGLAQLWRKLHDSEVEERAKVQELLKRTQEMSSDMHALSHRLYSSKLEYVGLVPALRGLCEEIHQKYGIQVEFASPEGFPVVSREVALCLFRICQESLGNTVKHSGARMATVQISTNNDEIDLTILDDGSGFDTELRGRNSGIGLIGMVERLRLAGGTLTVESAPGQGTKILAQVPLAGTSHEAERKSAAATK